MMNQALRMGALTLLVGVSGASSALAAAPAYGSLPTGRLTQTPTFAERPTSIGANEKVDGIHPAFSPDQNMLRGSMGTRYISVFGDKASAADFAAGRYTGVVRGRSSDYTAPRACFVTADGWRLRNDDRAWDQGGQAQPSIYSAVKGSVAAKQGTESGPTAIHAERLLLEGALLPGGPLPGAATRARLEVTDAWIDPQTLGVRLIGRATIPLTRVADGPEGLLVFAARQEDGSVHFVVKMPELDEQSFGFVGRHALIARGANMMSSDCGHARLTLRSARGGGEQGSVRIELAMRDGATKRNASTVEASDSPLRRLFVGAPEAPDEIREVRVRPLLVHLSASQTSSASEPLVSVSFGWQGRERRMQF